MSKGTIIFTILMLWTLFIHGGITYLIVKKKEYSLLSGFYNRPEEEREYLIKNGYIDKIGHVLKVSFYLLLLAFLLTIFNVPYGPAIGFGLFTVYTFIGIMNVLRFEVPHKRKKTMWIIGSIFLVTTVIVGVLLIMSFTDEEITITDETFSISGMYGGEWSIDDIENVEMLEELPEIIVRNNGVSTSNLLKGNFRLEEPYGRGKLFIKRGFAPYLYIKTNDEFVILNRENPADLEKIYHELINKVR